MASLSTDVFIIGGGPAGLAAGIAARRKGFRVMLAECARPPVDKACGEGLMPDGIAALHALGVTLQGSESWSFRGIRFVDSGAHAEACFPSRFGVGVRRTVLHRAMVDAASRAGVSLLWGTRVGGIGPQGVSVGGETVRCRWVIGADGTNSRVRQWAGLDGGSRRVRFGFRRHYGVAPWSEFMEIHWANGFQIYVTPVRADEICLTLLADDSHCRLDDALALLPDLASHFTGVRPLSTERGALSVSRRLAAVCRDNVALVGDASGSVDAITGEGLRLAFRQALSLADALEAGDLSKYEAQHRRIRKAPALMAFLMLAMADRPGLRRRAVRVFAAKPVIFDRMVAMHVGALPPLQLASVVLALGWQILMS